VWIEQQRLAGQANADGRSAVKISAGRVTSHSFRVERWPSEIPLLLVTEMVSLTNWIVAVVTIVGLVYGGWIKGLR
jgi:hypothetical protein